MIRRARHLARWSLLLTLLTTALSAAAFDLQGELLDAESGAPIAEVAVLLPDTDAEGAMQVARRLWEVIREQPFEVGDVLSIDLTISVGVATRRPADGQRTRDLVAAADRALYRAKESGRDQVLAG